MRATFLLLTILAGAAHAGDDDDALNLADSTKTEASSAKPFGAFVETAQIGNKGRDSSSSHQARLSVDMHIDSRLTGNLRGVFADRLDIIGNGAFNSSKTTNTLKEAYLSWQSSNQTFIDVGRVNLKYGSAVGYNPTDFFKSGSIRQYVTLDPTALRDTRMGTVIARVDRLWDDGSVSVLVAPKLANAPSDVGISADLGATNSMTRWAIVSSQKLSGKVTSQVMLYGAGSQDTRAGLNLSAVAGDATVLFLEWAGAYVQPQVARALGTSSARSLQNQMAIGATYTTSNKISVTLEYDYDGAAMTKRGWDGLQRGSTLAYATYRRWAINAQEQPTQHRTFAFVTWRDAMIDRLDISALSRFNVDDRSAMYWLEARYHWDKVEMALQYQYNRGGATSDFGAASARRSWQLNGRFYF